MALRIYRNGGIRATGRDASGFLIALADDDRLRQWEADKTGDENFQRMVREAIAARAQHSADNPKS